MYLLVPVGLGILDGWNAMDRQRERQVGGQVGGQAAGIDSGHCMECCLSPFLFYTEVLVVMVTWLESTIWFSSSLYCS